MHRSTATGALILALLALGLVPAKAGGASSAPSKYGYQTVSQSLTRYYRSVQAAIYRITEFSSSSARASVPKR